MKSKNIFIHSAYNSFNLEAKRGLKSPESFGLDLFFTFREIFKKIKETNNLIISQDPFPEMPENSILIYIDLPRIETKKESFIRYLNKNNKSNNKIKLWLFEPHSIRANQYQFIENYHYMFSSIFTWSEDILKKFDNSKILFCPIINLERNKKNYSTLENTIKKELLTKEISISFIGSNKSSLYPLNGYHFRIYILASLFKLTNKIFIYGNGWNQAHILPFRPNIFKRLIEFLMPKINKLGIVMGLSKDKSKSIKSHHYSLCIENEIGSKGYITEKIFDVLKELRLPIVFKTDELFPDEFKEYIIEISKFSSIDLLVKYLSELYKSGEYFNKISSLNSLIEKSQLQEKIINSSVEAIIK
ncbi:MAG: hypothetical protein JJ831_08040 [Prochlorococcus marinus XMU1422]|nr:hypothetical protein [Prochlorococcus marinus XMU1421]MBO7013250.1 hypothetical protein [Prochlorococcus marinus XMU1422]MCR8542295.1 glycosyltransferase family 10 [Prochlorococcus marinus XMU1423]